MHNLPVVSREKYDKLERVVRKIYSQIGVIKEGGLLMPVDPDTQKTLGFCFIEYKSIFSSLQKRSVSKAIFYSKK